MFENNKDITNGLKALGGVFVGSFFLPRLAPLAFMGIALYFGWIGLNALFSRNVKGTANSSEQREPIRPTASAPITNEPTIADRIKSIHVHNDFKCPSCGATVNPTDMKCGHCGSFLVASANLPKPIRWGEVEIDQAIRLVHPKQGKLALPVIRRVYYGELWQEKMRSDVPWTLTGNYYVGLGLDKEIFLLNWQSRFYLLDSHSPLTDMDINRDFAPYARKFAASNQTASVFFEYRGTNMRITDIGRFRIEFADGEGTQVSSGAVGRFIHAGHDNVALAVEDYQSGGSGFDTLRQGYQIDEKDIEL